VQSQVQEPKPKFAVHTSNGVKMTSVSRSTCFSVSPTRSPALRLRRERAQTRQSRISGPVCKSRHPPRLRTRSPSDNAVPRQRRSL
jgi:hypothetical protein